MELLLGLAFAFGALAQEQTVSDKPLPTTKAPESDVPIAAKDVLGDTGAPYENLFRPVNVSTRILPKIGPGQGHFNFALFQGPRIDIPLIERGFRPADAEVKIGPLYLDFRYLKTGLLYSDNVRWSENNRKDGFISIVALNLYAALQLNEGIRISVNGSLVWLPFQNKAGVAGFGLNDPTLLDFSSLPLAHAQLTYDFLLGGWNVMLMDDFLVRNLSYRWGYQNWDIFEGEQFLEEDRAGRYSFKEVGAILDPVDPNRNQRIEPDALEFRNQAGGEISRMLPTETHMSVSAYHYNFWYSGDHAGLPAERDVITAVLRNQRENMRFKPFLLYIASHDDIHPGWDQTVRGGIYGPITENTDFLGDVGYFQRGESDAGHLLWRLEVRNTPGPSTYQSIEFARYVTYPDEDLRQGFTYIYRHRFGPYLTGHLATAYETFEDLDNNNSGSREWWVQTKLSVDLGPRTALWAGVRYRDIHYEATGAGDVKSWVARVDLSRKIRETIEARLTYQYQDFNSSVAGKSFYENLILLMIYKYF